MTDSNRRNTNPDEHLFASKRNSDGSNFDNGMEAEVTIKIETDPDEDKSTAEEAEDDEDEDDFEGEINERPERRAKSPSNPHFYSRRSSKGNIFGRVGVSSSVPCRSLSFNSTRDKLKIHEHRMTPQRSPILSSRRSRSPQSSHPSSPMMGGNTALHRRSIGPADSKLVVLGVPCVGKSGNLVALLKSTYGDLKVLVFGRPCVGKSAIVVRLLTGRFIWEYDPTLEAVYRYHTTVDDDPATIDVLDTAGMMDGNVDESHVRWGDGFLIVYNLTDRESFTAVADIHASIASLKHTPNFPCVLLANKSDLVHLSKVCEEEASTLASDLGVAFYNSSASEGSPTIWEAFSELHSDVVRRRRTCNRRRRSSAKVVIEGFYKMFSR